MATNALQLSAEQLLQSVQPPATEEIIPTGLAERREFQRVPFRGRAKAIIFPAPTSPASTTLHDSEVVTSDLSRGGVSFLCRSKLLLGQQLMLMVHDKPQLAEVRWCSPVWDGLFAAGCRFIVEPQDLDVDQQLAAIDVVISNEANWWDVTKSA